MITVTDAAREEAQRLMGKENLSETAFLRISVSSGGCSGLSYNLEFETKKIKEDDREFEDNRLRVVVDKKSLIYLAGTTLDYSDGLNGQGFTFSNPNASRTCSCGDSFSL